MEVGRAADRIIPAAGLRSCDEAGPRKDAGNGRQLLADSKHILAQRKIGVAGCEIRYASQQITPRWLMGVGAGFVRYLPFRIS